MAESKNYTVVGLGEILWDLLPGGKQMGGAPSNFAYHAQALGASSLVVSAIGNDELGREIIENLKSHELDYQHVAIDGEHPTGTVTVELDGAGKPDYTIHENVAWDFISTTDEVIGVAVGADAVCFGSLAQRSPVSCKTIREFLKATRPGCLRVYDINLRQTYYDKETIDESLRLANVFKLNDEELPVVAELLSIQGNEDEVILKIIKKYNLKVAALTKGSEGSSLITADQKAEHEGFKPESIADTVGAGDSFTAAIVVGLLMGKPLDEICKSANRLASYVCSQQGAMPVTVNESLM